MLDLHLKYDPNISISNFLSGETTDPGIAATYLRAGAMPHNLSNISEVSTNFRDAVIYSLITTSDAGEAGKVLQLLSAALSTTPDEMTNAVRIYSEYLAPLSYVWGETVLATRAILRNEPSKAGSFLSTIADALNKKMDVEHFKTLLVNSTANSVNIVNLERAQGKY